MRRAELVCVAKERELCAAMIFNFSFFSLCDFLELTGEVELNLCDSSQGFCILSSVC